MIVKLVAEINELKAKVNTLELENELLRDKTINELVKKLDESNKYEKIQKENEKLRIKLQEAREIIKELKVK